MLWAALGYGLLLGWAQFYLIKALAKQALGKNAPGRLPVKLLAGLLGYVAAALGAVYLFESLLVPAAVGIGLGFFIPAGLWLYGKIKKLQ